LIEKENLDGFFDSRYKEKKKMTSTEMTVESSGSSCKIQNRTLYSVSTIDAWGSIDEL
jgi:hypothetical protein